MNSDNAQEIKQDSKAVQANKNKYVDFLSQQNPKGVPKIEKIDKNQKRSQHNSRSIKRNVDKKSFSNNNKIGQGDKKGEIGAKLEQSKGSNKVNNRYQNGESSIKYQSIKNKEFKRIQRIYTQNPAQNTSITNKIPNGTHYDSLLLQPQQKDNNINTKKNSLLTDMFSHSDYKTNKKANYRLEEKRKSHNNTITSSNYNKDHPPIASKEQLYEENMHLKSLINELKSSMTKHKIQIQLEKRKNKKFTTQLNREFKKQIYYRGQGHPGLSSLFQLNEYLDEDQIQQQKISRMYSNLKDASEDENIQSSPSRQKIEQNSLPSIANSRMNRIFNYIPVPTDPNIVHSSEYMIAGIKQKYEQLEIKYKNVTEQLKALKNIPTMNKLQQLSIYCTVLEESNKKLSSALQTCKEKLAASEGKQQIHLQVYQTAIVQQLNQKIQSLKEKNKKVKERNRKLQKQSKQNVKVIDYLEKIIISKDNFQQKSSIAVKKMNLRMVELEKQLSRQKVQHIQLKQTYKMQQQKSRKNHENETKNLQKLLDDTLNEKNGIIKKLEKEINYLMTIIDNWKLTESRDKKQSKNLQKKRKSSNITGRDQSLTERSNQPSLGQNSKVQQKKQAEPEIQKKSIQSRIRQIRQSQLQNSQRKGKQTSSQDRKRRTSGIKHNEQSKKQRKVNIQQIIELPQYIRYRLIGSNIQIQQICKYFDYRPIDVSEVNQSQNHFEHEPDPHEISEIEKWKKIFINQAEMTSIFMQEPFHLKTQQALLLARYIIQDQEFFQNGDPNNAFVYTDFENQVDRNVAKSIIKSFIQMHSTNVFQNVKGGVKKFEKCQLEWSQIIKKFGSRINTPLMTIAASGKISKQKWVQLIKSIVAEITEDVLEWTIGKMLVESQGLEKLKYRIVVPSGL